MDDMRYVILKASRHFTERQKSRLVVPQDMHEAGMKFSLLIHWELQKGHWLQHKFWNAASVIVQSEELCPTEDDVRAFASWAFGVLDYRGPVDA